MNQTKLFVISRFLWFRASSKDLIETLQLFSLCKYSVEFFSNISYFSFSSLISWLICCSFNLYLSLIFSISASKVDLSLQIKANSCIFEKALIIFFRIKQLYNPLILPIFYFKTIQKWIRWSVFEYFHSVKAFNWTSFSFEVVFLSGVSTIVSISTREKFHFSWVTFWPNPDNLIFVVELLLDSD